MTQSKLSSEYLPPIVNFNIENLVGAVFKEIKNSICKSKYDCATLFTARCLSTEFECITEKSRKLEGFPIWLNWHYLLDDTFVISILFGVSEYKFQLQTGYEFNNENKREIKEN